MKELSIKEKAKRYDEALEQAKRWHKAFVMGHNYPATDIKVSYEIMFPELKESENERIKREIITYLSTVEDKELIPYESWIAWLEKQGEQKSVVIIPKFRIGDNIKTTNEEPLTITKIDDKGYWSEDLFICNFDDADKWELVEQKPAWSEEDEKIAKTIINEFEQCSEWCCANGLTKEDCVAWLESLKQRYTWKPSDEQMNLLEELVEDNSQRYFYTILKSLYEQLKKLREE